MSSGGDRGSLCREGKGVWEEEQHRSVSPLSQPRNSFFLSPKKEGSSGRKPKSPLVQTLSETDLEAKQDTGRKETLGFSQCGSGALESSGAAPGMGCFRSVPG